MSTADTVLHFQTGVSVSDADAKPACKDGTGQASPFASLVERPEMELDLWEGQFHLSSPNLEHLTSTLSTDELLELGLADTDSSTHWGEDSTVTMGTVQQLQDQAGLLAESQTIEEERYLAIRNDNSSLANRLFILEEQLREAEEKQERAVREERRKSKEMMEKLQRELQREQDSCNSKMHSLEEENEKLRVKTTDLQMLLDAAIKEKELIGEKLLNCEHEVNREKEEQKILREHLEIKTKSWDEERESTSHIIRQMSSEIGRLKGLKTDSSETDSGCHLQEIDDIFMDLPARMAEMEMELRSVKVNTQKLQRILQTGKGVDIGLVDRNQELEDILNTGPEEVQKSGDNQNNAKTLASELEDIKCCDKEDESIKLQKLLTEQQDVNLQLQSYIDSVLLNIMERHPELLEVRS